MEEYIKSLYSIDIEAIMKLLSCEQELACKVFEHIMTEYGNRELFTMMNFLHAYLVGDIRDDYFQMKAEIRAIAEKYMPGTKEE